MNNEKFVGTLKTFDPIKGYGFITRDKGKDVFVYFDDFESGDKDAGAVVGAIVEFNIEQRNKGPVAKNVRIIG
ncbi:MAG: cold shock domain-containing protein [Candidatus Aquirickettsiella gammari]